MEVHGVADQVARGDEVVRRLAAEVAVPLAALAGHAVLKPTCQASVASVVGTNMGARGLLA